MELAADIVRITKQRIAVLEVQITSFAVGSQQQLAAAEEVGGLKERCRSASELVAMGANILSLGAQKLAAESTSSLVLCTTSRLAELEEQMAKTDRSEQQNAIAQQIGEQKERRRSALELMALHDVVASKENHRQPQIVLTSNPWAH